MLTHPKIYGVQFAPDGLALDWNKAEVLTNFQFPWEDRPAPDTQFRALWDREHLHFRFDCVDDDLVLGVDPDGKPKVADSDRVEIFFAPDLSLNPYYGLEMDPRGQVLAYRARFHRQFDWDWRCPGLHLEAEIEGNRYWVRGRLPLATLVELAGLGPAGQIHAGLYRGEFSHAADGKVRPGWMAWVDPQTPIPDFHVPASFGILKLVGYGE